MRYTAFFLFLLASTASAATGNGNGKQCNLQSLRVATVVTPDTRALYDESRAQWASDLGSTSLSDFMLSPDAIVYCESDMDVVATVAFASRCGYSLSVRSGGHQFSGYSSCKKDSKCIQVDVSKLEVFDHDAATDVVTIGVGLVLEQIIGQLVPLGLVVPMGVCNTVGAGGHFQTSSYGAFARPFGLGMDFVQSFRIVTADAQILTATPSSHPDLYKAVLGGGPGSFGVVLDYTVQAIRSDAYPNSAAAFLLAPYTRDIYDVVLPLYREITALPEYARDFTAYLEIRYEGGQHLIALIMAWVGIDNTGSFVDDGHHAKTVQPFIDTGFFNVLLDGPLPLHFYMDQARTEFDYMPSESQRYHVHNFHSEQPYSLELIAENGNEIDAYLAIPNVRVSIQFQAWGGTGEGSGYNRNTGLNAYPTRKVFMSNDNWVDFPESELQQVETILAEFKTKYAKLVEGEVEEMWLTLDTLTSDTADLSKDWPKYYPNQEAFAFVQKVKQQYDPDDVFRSDMTVPLP